MINFSKDHLILAEKPYTSIQGEGRFVGIPMTYVRTQGCNVACDWCDSKYTWFPYYQTDKVKEITTQYDTVGFEQLNSIIEKELSTHVWFTGGEPMLQDESIINYLQSFQSNEKKYHICTAGRRYNGKLFDLLDYITVDVKAPFSKTESDLDVIRMIHQTFNKKLELKMVVAPIDIDMEYAKYIANQFSDISLTLQPLYVSETELMEDKSLRADHSYWGLQEFASWVNEWGRHYENVRMGTQLHKIIWPRKLRMI